MYPSLFTKLLRAAGLSRPKPPCIPEAEPKPPALIAIVTDDGDRATLLAMCETEPWDVFVAETCEEAWRMAESKRAPVILYDRDFPGVEWREAVGMLSALPQRAVVILLSQVADEYLWNELFRIGGFDVLRKPLRADDLARVLKLALAYWHSETGRLDAPAVKPA